MNMNTQTHKPLAQALMPYIAGLASSIALTLAAYCLAINHGSVQGLAGLAPWTLAGIFIVLALAQFVLQLFFFMHVRLRTRPRWQLVTLTFMAIVVLILVGGSIWIMASMNGRMGMTPDQVNQYMEDQAGI